MHLCRLLIRIHILNRLLGCKDRKHDRTYRQCFLLRRTMKCSFETIFVTQLLTITVMAAIVITLSSYTQQELN